MEELNINLSTSSNLEMKNWNDNLTEEDISYYFHKELKENINPYKFNKILNSKLFLINKNILNLKLENPQNALVLQTSKNLLKQTTQYRSKILKECGLKITEELELINNNNPISLAECAITQSYQLNSIFTKIIHVVLPKYTNSYQMACESSLHLSIRNVIDISIQNGIRSLIFGCDVMKPSNNFPIISAVTVVLRTIRKCLEKLNDKFDSILFVIEDRELFDKFRETFKMYFPRNIEEEVFYGKYLPNILQTEYGDVIIPERHLNVVSEFTVLKKDYCVDIVNKKPVESYYMMDENDIRDYKMNDKQRIEESVLNSKDFAKKFYFENTKLLHDDLLTFFTNLNFIQFKGTDLMQRQIFYFNLDKINFYDIDNDHQTDPLIIFITTYLKENLKRLDRISFILFSENIKRINFPTISFTQNLMKILYSNSIQNYIDINSIQIIFYKPSFIFKLYIYFLRIYLEKEIWSQIEFSESKEDLNEKFGLEF